MRLTLGGVGPPGSPLHPERKPRERAFILPLLKRRIVYALLLGLGVSVFVTVSSRLGSLEGWETRVIDTFLFFRQRVPSPDIVLVVMNEAAFQELGERQPLSRRYVADLAEFLIRAGARTVAFDVLFKSRSVPEEDEALLALARRSEATGSGRLVYASLAIAKTVDGRERYETSVPFSPDLRGAFGFANAPMSPDGVIRRMAPVLPAGDGRFVPSLALAALARYAGFSGQDLALALMGQPDATLALPVYGADGRIVATEPVSIRTLSEHWWRIDFAGPPGTFTTFPSGPLVRLARSGELTADNPFKGKIVLIGATFADSREFYATPVGQMSGVEIHANMIHTLLSRRALLPPHWALNLAPLFIACFAVALLSVRLRRLWVFVAMWGIVAVLAAFSYEAYFRGYWLDFVVPLAGMRMYLGVSRRIARRRLQTAFGQYVSPEIVELVVRDGAQLDGEVRTVSVLLSDLRGFTALAEKLPLEEITIILNEYIGAMVEIIMKAGGMVIDLIGDGILAVFGAPVDDPDHAWHAVGSAVEMENALDRLNDGWRRRGWESLQMGIAVHTGRVFAGSIGSGLKKKYAVVGDTVSTVSRIEGLNSELSTRILISGASLEVVRDRVVVKERGVVNVKGRTQEVPIFELLHLAAVSPEMAGVH
ncbi:MAG: adenylate/guanylate cyclase domain-containing protein [Candidatus Rokubacteria bacterium]|nr:adenylate/guanylate cyclase domain-containing protein [Candidatus Rokubacteria bacterium]